MKMQHSKNSLYGVLFAVLLANVALSIASAPVVAADPSFDCNKAQRPDEFAICTSNRLSALDELASFGYVSIRNSVGRQQANEANMPFIKDRIECLNNANCIQRTQILAIRTFQRMGAPISEYQIQRALLERMDTRTTAVDVAQAQRREEQENQKRAEEESRKRAADWQAAQQAQEEQRRLAKVEETRLAALKQEVETQRLELARIAADKAKAAADAAKANEERARIASEQIRKEQQKAEDESRERMALIKEQEDKRKLQLAQLETDRLKAEAEIAKARLESERMAAQESERQRQIAEAQYKNSWGYWFSSWFGSDEKVKNADAQQKTVAKDIQASSVATSSPPSAAGVLVNDKAQPPAPQTQLPPTAPVSTLSAGDQQGCAKIPSFGDVKAPMDQVRILQGLIREEFNYKNEIAKQGRILENIISDREKEKYKNDNPIRRPKNQSDIEGLEVNRWMCTIDGELRPDQLKLYPTTIRVPGIEREWNESRDLRDGSVWGKGGGINLDGPNTMEQMNRGTYKVYSTPPVYNKEIGHIVNFPLCIADRLDPQAQTGNIPVYFGFNHNAITDTQVKKDNKIFDSDRQVYRSFPTKILENYMKKNKKFYANDRISFSGKVEFVTFTDRCELLVQFDGTDVDVAN